MNIRWRMVWVLVAAVSYVFFVGFEITHFDGWVGATKKNGFGCICHSFTTTDSVSVWIEGPSTVRTGSKTLYTLLMKGGPSTAGGFNVASDRGILSAVDTTAQLISDELTHTLPKAFQQDTVKWEFYYEAPSDSSIDSLYSVANSVNNTGDPSGDQWNYGNNFVITIHRDTTTSAEIDDEQPLNFKLYQNYPNPFNPITHVRFRTLAVGFVSLKIYTVRGEEVVTLVHQLLSPGFHEIEWDGTNSPSGIYFYMLRAGNLVETKKMVLIR